MQKRTREAIEAHVAQVVADVQSRALGFAPGVPQPDGSRYARLIDSLVAVKDQLPEAEKSIRDYCIQVGVRDPSVIARFASDALAAIGKSGFGLAGIQQGGAPGTAQREAVQFEAEALLFAAGALNRAKVAIELKIHEDSPRTTRLPIGSSSRQVAREVIAGRGGATMEPMDASTTSADDLVAALRRFQSACRDFWLANDAYDDLGDDEADYGAAQRLKDDLIDAAGDVRRVSEVIRIEFVRKIPSPNGRDPFALLRTISVDLIQLAYANNNHHAREPILTFLQEAIAKAKRWRPSDAGPATQLSQRGTKIVIGHGRSPAWIELRDLLRETLKLEVVEFNSEPVPGFTHKERLLQMRAVAGMAFLVMTAEDEQPDGKKRPRQNVVHEAGFFQGSLGFERAIILLEDDCALFSNVDGINYIGFSRGKIRGSFEDVRGVLTREKFLK